MKNRANHYLVRMSEEAYNGLVDQARMYGWIPAANPTNTGLSRYLAHVSTLTYSDTRPEDIIYLDHNLLSHNSLPYWTLQFPKRRYLLRMTPQTKLNFTKIAFRYGIASRYRKQDDSLIPTMVPATLEAIGIGWLTALDVQSPNRNRMEHAIRN